MRAVGVDGRARRDGGRRAAAAGEQPAAAVGRGAVAGPGIRSATVGWLLCAAGAATLTSVAWGLKDQGVYCVVVVLAALVVARALARD